MSFLLIFIYIFGTTAIDDKNYYFNYKVTDLTLNNL